MRVIIVHVMEFWTERAEAMLHVRTLRRIDARRRYLQIIAEEIRPE